MEHFPNIPGYRISKRLGRGRVTDLYLGIKKDIIQEVVVKILLPDLGQDTHFADRFLDEARRVTQLDHPNIGKILDIDETEHFFYYVAEAFPECLRDRIIRDQLTADLELDLGDQVMANEEEEGIDPREVLAIFKQLAQALDEAHKRGFVHRDIRPGNVFLKSNGQAVLVDFNISPLIAVSDVLKKREVTVTPPHYVSPEEALRQPVDKTCDFYSLGVMLYEVLMGKVPYDAEDVREIEKLHIMGPIPQLPEKYSLFQPMLNFMMAKKKEDRIQSGAELVFMINELAAELPPGAHADKTEDLDPQKESSAEYELKNILGQMEKDIEEDPFAGTTDFSDQIERTEYPSSPQPPTPEPSPPISPSPTSFSFPEPSDTQPLVDMAVAQMENNLTSTYQSPSSEDDTLVDPMDIPLEDDGDYDLLEDDNSESHEPEKKSFLKAGGSAGGGFLSDILEKIKEPKIMIAGGAAVVLIIVALIFLLPFGGSDSEASGENNGNQSVDQQNKTGENKGTDSSTENVVEKKPLTPQQKTKLDYKLKLSQKQFDSGNFQKSLQLLDQAEEIAKTEETQKMRVNIDKKLAEQEDHNAYKKAMKTETLDAFREYQTKYPSGLHKEDAEKKIKELEEEKRKRKEEEARWAKLRVKLRSTYESLTVEQVKEMLAKRNLFEKYYNNKGNFRNYYSLKKNGNETVVVDNATGLMWHWVGSPSYMKYEEAEAWVKKLNDGKYFGFSDWRIPTLEEAGSLLEGKENRFSLYIDIIFSKDVRYTWTGDRFEPNKYWAVDFYGGDFSRVPPTYESYVLPVRNLK